MIKCTCVKKKKVVCINFTELDEDAVRDPTLVDDFDADGYSGNLRTGYSNARLGSRARYPFLYVRSHDHHHGHRVAVQSQRVAEAAVKTLS